MQTVKITHGIIMKAPDRAVLYLLYILHYIQILSSILALINLWRITWLFG